jgi:DNA-directed RNA polymerase III subunit RPC6
VLERVYKTLEARGLIKSMKHVKHPGRKIYILAGLEPSEEATGGAWFSEGGLDVGLVDTISKVVEHYVSQNSWQSVEPDDSHDQPTSPGHKRKAPSAGFESRGEERAKAVKSNEGQHKVRGSKQILPKFLPFDAGHRSYPTLRDITRHVLDTKVTATVLLQNAISQLLEVMVYDDRLFKMHRSPDDDEIPDDPVANTVTMYRCFKRPTDLFEQHQLDKRKVSSHENTRKAAHRQQELEDIGRGGSSEVPCMRCPVFDICGDGGPVNVVTCKYFDEWYVKLAEADMETGIEQHGSKEKPKGKHKPAGKPEDNSLANGDSGPTVEVALEPS